MISKKPDFSLGGRGRGARVLLGKSIFKFAPKPGSDAATHRQSTSPLSLPITPHSLTNRSPGHNLHRPCNLIVQRSQPIPQLPGTLLRTSGLANSMLLSLTRFFLTTLFFQLVSLAPKNFDQCYCCNHDLCLRPCSGLKSRARWRLLHSPFQFV